MSGSVTILPEQRNCRVLMADKTDDMVIAPPKPTANPFAAADADAPSTVSQVASRLTRLPGGLVDGGEIIILAIKPSMWRPVFDSAAWLVTFSLLAIALTVWQSPLPGLSVTTTAQMMFLIGLGRLGLAVVNWIPTWYVLTNRRLIDIHGVRLPRICACRLIDVRNTYLNAPPSEKALGLGTITYVTADEKDSPHFWRSVASPDAVHTEIRRAIENAIDAQGTAQSL